MSGRFQRIDKPDVSENLVKRKGATQDRSKYKSLCITDKDMQKLDSFALTLKIHDPKKIYSPHLKTEIVRNALEEYYNNILDRLPSEVKEKFEALTRE
ncbi:MAG: hypothetical protein ACRC26_08135 [Bacteroidales bacterium]